MLISRGAAIPLPLGDLGPVSVVTDCPLDNHLQMALIDRDQVVEAFAAQARPSRSQTALALGDRTGVGRTLTPRPVTSISNCLEKMVSSSWTTKR